MKTTGKLVFHKSGLGEGQTSESRTIREDLGTQERFPKGKMIKEAGPCPASLLPPVSCPCPWPLVDLRLREAGGLSWYNRRKKDMPFYLLPVT